jgi:amino acid efflux transporter
MSTLVQIPNAALILTYLGGCAAGIKLLKGSKIGTIVSIVSLILTIAILLFVKWTILYPIIISVFWFAYCLAVKKFSLKKDNKVRNTK